MSRLGLALPRGRLRGTVSGYLFLAPWLIGVLTLTVGPALASLYLSFTDYAVIDTPYWVGADNYVRILTDDPRFLSAVEVTLWYVLLSVPLKLTFALAVAVALNKRLPGMTVFRAVFYLPSLMGGSVAIAILWRQFFSREGVFNQFLGFLGYDAPNWIATPDYSLYTLVVLSIWQFGSPMIIFLAGLRQIPKDMYEAADLDGAGTARQFFQITLPLLTPVIFFNVIVQTIEAFKAFTPAFVISDGTGGPVDSTLFYTLYLYQEAFVNFRMGYASALAWILVIAIAVFTAIAFRSSRLWVHYDD